MFHTSKNSKWHTYAPIIDYYSSALNIQPLNETCNTYALTHANDDQTPAGRLPNNGKGRLPPRQPRAHMRYFHAYGAFAESEGLFKTLLK